MHAGLWDGDGCVLAMSTADSTRLLDRDESAFLLGDYVLLFFKAVG